MMMAKIFILTFCVIFTNIICAQQQQKNEENSITYLTEKLSKTPSDPDKIRLLLKISSAYLYDDDHENSRRYTSLALNLLSRYSKNPDLKYKIFQAKALENLGSAMSYEDVPKALVYLEKSLKLAQEINDKESIASVYFAFGRTYSFKNDHNAALIYLNKSLDLYQQTKNKREIFEVLYCISLEKRYLKMYGDALEYSIKSVKIAEELKDTLSITKALLANGFNFIFVKNYADAIQVQKKALKLFQLTNDSIGIATAYNDMGVAEMTAKQTNEALKYHQKALEIRTKLNAQSSVANSNIYIAEAFLAQGKLQEALAAAKAAIPNALKAGDSRIILESYLQIGEIYEKIKDYKNALRYYQLSRVVAIKNNSQSMEAIALTRIGTTYKNAGNLKEALNVLKAADQIVQKKDFFNRQSIYRVLAEIYINGQDYKNAFDNQVKFQQMTDSLNSIEKTEKVTSLTQQLIYENKRALQKASQDREIAIKESQISQQKVIRNLSIAGLLIGLLLAIVFFVRLKEKRKLNVALEKSLVDLKDTQKQLIHSEKMASLGELTAGIAHEIQNPLNFVNNFSDVSNEILQDIKEERKKDKADRDEVYENELLEDISKNLEKINHHGKRAEAIVKGMLQHSRTSNGLKEATDLNELCDEYLRLSYHGLRAKDKTFNAVIQTDFDESIGKINLISQDFGRVVLNLVNNAFYAINEKKKTHPKNYQPTVSITTKRENDAILIKISDNGNGMPEEIKDKIFQPFFTTKPTGQGTGLGLSICYDIIAKGHSGDLKVQSVENEGTTFSIILKNIEP